MSGIETIGMDVGGTKALTGVVDAQSQVFHEGRETTAGLDSDQLLAIFEKGIMAARAARPDAAAVGIGLPCTIDQEQGRVIGAVNLDLVDQPIRDELSARVGLPVSIDNDVNTAVLAESLYGAARGAKNVVMVTVGTGIGGGLILGGEVYRGRNGSGAEMGHTVIAVDGPPCQGHCPGRGCVETLASGTALGREGRLAAEREPDSALGRLVAAGTVIDGTQVTVAAKDGDVVAREVYREQQAGSQRASLSHVSSPTSRDFGQPR